MNPSIKGRLRNVVENGLDGYPEAGAGATRGLAIADHIGIFTCP